MRSMAYVFIGSPRMGKLCGKGVMEGSTMMLLGMLLMALGSIYMGYIAEKLIVGTMPEIIVTTLSKLMPIILGALGGLGG